MRNLILLWIGQFISQTGDSLFQVSIIFLILLIETKSPSTKAGFVNLLNTAPFLIFGLISGTLVDRFNRKRLMLVSDAVRGVLLLFIPLIYMYGILSWLVMAGAGFMLATFSTVFNPARDAIIPELARSRNLLKVNAFFQTSQQLAMIFGAMLAGIFMQVQGGYALSVSAQTGVIVKLLFLDGLTFFVSFLTILFIKISAQLPPDSQSYPAYEDIKRGFRYVYNDSLLKTLLLLTAVDNLFIMGPAIVGANLLIKNTFNLGPSHLAFFEGTLAAGCFLSALFIGKYGKRFRKGQILLAGIFLDGFTYLPFPFIQSYTGSLVAIFIHSWSIPLIIVSRTAIVHEYVPNHQLGKVFALVNMTVVGSTALSSFVTGAMGDYIAPPTLFFLGGLGGVVCAVIGWYFRSIRTCP